VQSDKLKAEIKADEEKHGKRLDLTCLELIPNNDKVIIYGNGRAYTGFIAKTEVARLKRFVGIIAERYGV
jgi:hypothetical protein